MMEGRIMTASTMMAASRLSPAGTLKNSRMAGSSTIIPTRPYTTEGIPASRSTAGRIKMCIRDSSNPNAIGYASLSAVDDTVKAVKVNGVAPSEDTVKDGTYEIQRPFVMVTKEGAELSEAAQAFLEFAMSADVADYIAAAGAVSPKG